MVGQRAANINGLCGNLALRYVCAVLLTPAVGWSPAQRTLPILDQRMLPSAEVVRDLYTIDEVVDAIKTCAVRAAGALATAGIGTARAPIDAVPVARRRVPVDGISHRSPVCRTVVCSVSDCG